jgi:hypothetical protein
VPTMNTAKPTDTAVVEDFWADHKRDILNCLA